MALAGAIAALEWIRRQWRQAIVQYVSDSEYLVKGMNEWSKDWERRGLGGGRGAPAEVAVWGESEHGATAPTGELGWGGGDKQDAQKKKTQISGVRSPGQ